MQQRNENISCNEMRHQSTTGYLAGGSPLKIPHSIENDAQLQA